MPALDRASAWLNSGPLTVADLRGKVVLINFWTYSCINWLRTLPYLRAWAKKYKSAGLVVIGVHSPEFAFEKDVGNVRRAAQDMRVEYPIAIDSEHALWRAFPYRFHARDLHLVMGPTTRAKPMRFQVSIDGERPGTAHGIDVDEQGVGAITEPRLYQLVRQTTQPVAERQFEIVFSDPGVEVFAFTFG